MPLSNEQRQRVRYVVQYITSLQHKQSVNMAFNLGKENPEFADKNDSFKWINVNTYCSAYFFDM